MRAERLHSFLSALREDFDRTQLPALIAELDATYQGLASSPADPGLQQRASTASQQLEAALSHPMKVDERAWRDAATELRIDDLLGQDLLDALEEIFDREELTPSAVATALQPIAGRIAELNTNIDSALAAFAALSVGREDLEPGAWEIEIVIPRSWVDEQLEQLGEEFEQLDRILRPFVELEGGSRPPIVVTSISSSDFTVFVAAVGSMALAFAKAVNLLADSYAKIQQGRVAAQTLREMKLKEESLDDITEHVDGYMDRQAREISEVVVAEFGTGLDEGRAHEITTEMTKSVSRLAPRIERGFHFDVHYGELLPPEGAEADDLEAIGIADKNRKARETIDGARQAMQQLELTGEPILSLPPPLDGDEGEESNDSAA